MVSLLITLLIYLIVLGLVYWVISLIPLPPPFGLVSQVILAVVAAILIINLLLGIVPGARFGVP